MPRRFTGTGRLGLCAAAVGLLAACTSGSAQGVRTVTVGPATSGVTTAPAGSSPVTLPPTSSGSVAAPALTTLSGTCDTLLPAFEIEQALGHPLHGSTAFVVGKPDKDIGRLSYLNCRYGLPRTPTGAVPNVEIGISLYDTPADAAKRVAATLADYTTHGASAVDTTVAGRPATWLTGGVGEGYDIPLLVLARGQRTVAVSVAGSATASTAKVAAKLATLALSRTGG